MNLDKKFGKIFYLKQIIVGKFDGIEFQIFF